MHPGHVHIQSQAHLQPISETHKFDLENVENEDAHITALTHHVEIDGVIGTPNDESQPSVEFDKTQI